MTQKELDEILELHKMWLEDKGGKQADLSYEDLSDIDLSYANLSYANLNGANLNGANLNGANLIYVDLSGAKGLINPIDYLNKNFEKTEEGYIVYKTFGGHYDIPNNWEIKPNSVIEEEVDYNRCNDCGCGINVATKKWVEEDNNCVELPMWKLLIKWEWLPTVVVPYNTDGKIRCGKAMLLEVIN